jgi:ribosome-associated translation inhibitor RaiA
MHELAIKSKEINISEKMDDKVRKLQKKFIKLFTTKISIRPTPLE